MWSLSFSTAWYLGRCLNSWDPVSCKSGINSEICEYPSCTPKNRNLNTAIVYLQYEKFGFSTDSTETFTSTHRFHPLLPTYQISETILDPPGFSNWSPKAGPVNWTCVFWLFSSRPWPRKTGKIVATNYFIVIIFINILRKMCIFIAPCILHLVPYVIYFVFFLFTDISTYIWAISWQSDASKKHCTWNSNEVFDLDAGTWSTMIVMTFFLFESKQLNRWHMKKELKTQGQLGWLVMFFSKSCVLFRSGSRRKNQQTNDKTESF